MRGKESYAPRHDQLFPNGHCLTLNSAKYHQSIFEIQWFQQEFKALGSQAGTHPVHIILGVS